MLTLLPEPFIINDAPDRIQLKNVIYEYAGIHLNEMDKCTLLNRIDTKFVMTEKELIPVLKKLRSDYRILDINGIRLNHYRTQYFDTASFDLYYAHINRGCNCYKVRTREYVESQLMFMEVKYKNQKKRTIKNRVDQSILTSVDYIKTTDFLKDHYPYDYQQLEPKLWNTFTRITLVSKKNLERLTIDFDLNFIQKERQKGLPGIVVAEVKQDGFSFKSDFVQQMRNSGIRSMGFSKYCIGVSLLYDDVKKNSLKPKLLMVKRMQKGLVYG